jgi:hypothetical protein
LNIYLYYRTYWGKDSLSGWTGRNVIAKNKMEMVKTCLKSLQLSEQNIHTTACVDFSTDKYTKYLNTNFDEIFHSSIGFDVNDHKGKWPVFGGMGGLIKVLELIESKNHKDDDIILILEDDYLFDHNGFNEWIKACGNFNGFVSPFDHPDRYIRNDDLIFNKTEIHIFNNLHWRNAESTTSTIGGQYRYFKKTYFLRKLPRLHLWFFWPSRLIGKQLPSIDRVFYRRCYLWLRIKLYTPIPGLAVHLSKFIAPEDNIKKTKCTSIPDTQLSPGIDWKKRYKNLLEDIL